jgi:hypothetical protein
MIALQLINNLLPLTSSFNELQELTFKLVFRLLINLSTVFVLVRLIYFPIYKHRELFFTYFVFNLVIFFISFLLNKVELSMGAAFGLFAVFSMLRYKTEEIAIKDMTYLFLVIAIGLISAITTIKNSPENLEYIFIIGINAVILTVTYLLESSIFMKRELVKTILYENIEMIKDGKQNELVADLKLRTGCNVHRYTIYNIDFLKDSVQIKIYYYEE